MKKRVGSLTEIRPVTFTIDAISQLPSNIDIISQEERDASKDPAIAPKELLKERKRRIEDLRQSMQGSDGGYIEDVIRTIFTDQMEFESHVASRDGLTNQAQQLAGFAT